MSPGYLEHIAGKIRNTEARKPGETIDAYMRRTWAVALAEYESGIPELEHVREARERSDQRREEEARKDKRN